METKEQIRERMKAAREALGESGRREAGKGATERLLALPAFQNASEIYCYLDFGTEVPTGEILREAWRRHKRVWAPRVQGRQIRFYPVTSTGKLYPGVFGIPEPDSQKRLEADGNTLVIMPGAVFSEKRDRIGYGGGYYDVFLHDNPQCMTVAVCYDFQILTELPAEEHDIKPDVIVSSRRILR